MSTEFVVLWVVVGSLAFVVTLTYRFDRPDSAVWLAARVPHAIRGFVFHLYCFCFNVIRVQLFVLLFCSFVAAYGARHA
jgi:hypothetical protein